MMRECAWSAANLHPKQNFNRHPCSASQHTVANSLVFASCPAQDYVIQYLIFEP